MRTSVPRKFALVDATVLVAAMALAFVPIRLFLRNFGEDFPDNLSAAVSLAKDGVLDVGFFVHCFLVYPALTLSLALWLLRMRKPRPVLRRTFRQPGMAACTAALVSMILILIGFMVESVYGFRLGLMVPPPWDPANFAALWTNQSNWIGNAVAGAWTSLWLSGAWRSEPSWIDRAGRGLGTYWVADCILLGWVSFMG
ncbi:MAG: hypothetical protein ACHRXM_16420 [Isosphaerales bacterium]